jgi:hypothetical protein
MNFARNPLTPGLETRDPRTYNMGVLHAFETICKEHNRLGRFLIGSFRHQSVHTTESFGWSERFPHPFERKTLPFIAWGWSW